MNKYRVLGIVSVVISLAFFVLMFGFISGMEFETIGFVCGALGAFASAALWVAWLVLADFFWGGGF